MANHRTYTSAQLTSRQAQSGYASSHDNYYDHYDPYESFEYDYDADDAYSVRARTARRWPKILGMDSKILLIVAVALVVVIVALAVLPGACSRNGSTTAEDPTDAAQAGEQVTNRGAYNWSYLSKGENGRLSYDVAGEHKSRFGIDVSEHQGTIDWQAATEDGVEFAFIRVGYRGATEGNVKLDEQFTINFREARDWGVPVGIYFFSQAINEAEAREEAQFAVDQLDGAQIDYPIVFDAETLHELDSRANELSTEQATANAKAFCEVVEAAGYSAMIYGNIEDLNKFDLMALAKYPIWFAAYTDLPYDIADFALWQYSEHGQVAGIDHDVDLNIWIEKE